MEGSRIDYFSREPEKKFFKTQTNLKSGFEVKMGIKRKKGPGEVEEIKIEKEGDRKQEIVVLRKTLFQKD